MTAGWRRWFRIFRRDPQADVDAELRFHLDARVDDLIARGVTAEGARKQALAEFGDVDATRERLGAIDRRIAERNGRAEWWEAIAQDLRHALRGLARSRGFTIMVVVTLALGIGANAAVFAVLDRLFFAAPAGVAHPEQLRVIRVYASYPKDMPLPSGQSRTYVRGVYNYPEILTVSRAAPSSVSVAGYNEGSEPLGRDPGGPTVEATYTVGEYFHVLGVKPVRGRFFTGAELVPSGLTPVAVIGYDLWQRRYFGSDSVLGSTLDLGPHRFTIVGVAPRGFQGTAINASQVWLPFNTFTFESWAKRRADWYENPNSYYITMLARVSSRRTEDALHAVATQVLRASPATHDSKATVQLGALRGAPGLEFYESQVAISTHLAGVALIILLIACANVANLMLARALARRREVAVRLALGVSRRRLIGMFLTESLLVALVAAAAALILGSWGGSVLRNTLIPDTIWQGAPIDAAVAIVATLVALAAGLLAGLVPAIQASRPELTDSLRGGAREGRSSRSRTRTALLVVQAALSVVLLVGAGLFIRSLRDVTSLDVGYDVNRVLYAWARPNAEDVGAAQQMRAQFPQAAAALAHLPAVQKVAEAENPPFWGISFAEMFLPGIDSVLKLGPFGGPTLDYVSPGYFATLGVPLLGGRTFTDADREGAEPVVVVNRTMADDYWPKGDALGSCFMLERRDARCRRIVGIVGDARIMHMIEPPAPHFYVPLAQGVSAPRTPGVILIRTAPGAQAAVEPAAMQALIAAFGPSARPIVRPMAAAFAGELRPWRLGAALFSVFGLLALLVAAVGIYSTMAYTVSQRTHEIGVRLALGARRAHVARLVVGQGVRVVAVGVLLGVGVALAMGRLVASLLYATTPHDPAVLAATALVLLLASVVACFVPAWRAARVDPMEALRGE